MCYIVLLNQLNCVVEENLIAELLAIRTKISQNSETHFLQPFILRVEQELQDFGNVAPLK